MNPIYDEYRHSATTTLKTENQSISLSDKSCFPPNAFHKKTKTRAVLPMEKLGFNERRYCPRDKPVKG
jgi:hypothetical protein